MNTKQRPTPNSLQKHFRYDCEYRGDMGDKITASAGKLRPDGDHVPADFARQLERERDEAREQLEAMREAIKEAYDAIDEARECVYGEVSSWRAVDVNLPKCKEALAKLQHFLKP